MTTYTHTASSPRFGHLRAHLPAYLVGIGATAALTAGALVVFLSLAAFVTFNGFRSEARATTRGPRTSTRAPASRPRRRRPPSGRAPARWRGTPPASPTGRPPPVRGRRGIGLRRLRIRQCAIGRRRRQGPLRARRFDFTGGGDRSPNRRPAAVDLRSRRERGPERRQRRRHQPVGAAGGAAGAVDGAANQAGGRRGSSGLGGQAGGAVSGRQGQGARRRWGGRGPARPLTARSVRYLDIGAVAGRELHGPG